MNSTIYNELRDKIAESVEGIVIKQYSINKKSPEYPYRMNFEKTCDRYSYFERDIQLADVLIALQKILTGDDVYGVYSNGRFFNEDENCIDVYDEKWDLTKPLHEQKKSVLIFLHNLICKPNDK
jgi:hypothetical protein